METPGCFSITVKEEDSFVNHCDTKVMWSVRYVPNELEAKEVESHLLNYFGDQVDMGFNNQEDIQLIVRKYDHQKWIIKSQEYI
jgi:hypothetical protein